MSDAFTAGSAAVSTDHAEPLWDDMLTESLTSDAHEIIREKPVRKSPADDAQLTLESLDLSQVPPWLDNLLDSLQKMKSLGPEWSVEDFAPPNATAIDKAQCVLVELANAEPPLEPTLVEPSSDEGVCIAFWKGDKYADIECFNDGEVFASTHLRKAEPPKIWSVREDSIEETIEAIRIFINN